MGKKIIFDTKGGCFINQENKAALSLIQKIAKKNFKPGAIILLNPEEVEFMAKSSIEYPLGE